MHLACPISDPMHINYHVFALKKNHNLSFKIYTSKLQTESIYSELKYRHIDCCENIFSIVAI